MSFDPRFTARFEQVIVPAIRKLSWNGHPIEPHRVDLSLISDSIIAEIVEGITNDLAVLIDITTVGYLDERPVRNGNVMYELGLAHAIRRPEHVLVFRSDTDPLLFDVSGIRILNYAPDDDPEGAQEAVASAIVDSMRFGQRLNKWTVEQAAQSLDPLSLMFLMRVAGLPSLGPAFEDLKVASRDVRLQPSIHRLLELELIQMKPIKARSATNLSPASIDELVELETTRLGSEVMWLTFHRTGLWEAFAAANEQIARQFEDWRDQHPEEI